MRALIALTIVLSSAGCLFGEVSGIPCGVDGDCPSTYFCDIPNAECRETTGDFGEPNLEVRFFLDPRSAEPVRTPFVPPGETSTISLLPKNIGKSPATDLAITFATLECVQFAPQTSTLPDEIAPEATGQIDVDVTTGEGCGGLTIIDWFITYSGRETRGTFDLNIKEP